MKKYKKFIIIGIITILVILVLVFILINNNKKENIVVNYDEVETLYDNLKKTECIENCDERECVSKLYGYSYDSDGNVQMDVMEGYTEKNKVYNLEGEEIEEYSKDTLNDVLDKGTLKTYHYERNGEDYNLQK